MSTRYVDDINMAVQATKPRRIRYREGLMTIDKTATDGDREISAKARTMNIINEVRDVIHPSIKQKVDYPSKHEDGKRPIMDWKVWVDDRENEEQDIYELASKTMISAMTDTRQTLRR